jgi:hypothetical protein
LSTSNGSDFLSRNLTTPRASSSIGGQGIEFHQHDADGGVGYDRDHVFRASGNPFLGPASIPSRADGIPLAQIIFYEIRE